jgi:hypothetical protein
MFISLFFVFFHCLKKNYCPNFENMIWIEDIFESIPAHPFLTNSKADMADFVHPHKVFARKNAFSTFQYA